jgi:hypothetical protein
MAARSASVEWQWNVGRVTNQMRFLFHGQPQALP